MRSGPSKAAEAVVAMLTPPACREEVLGDLHERYTSGIEYGVDALCTVPLVIMSRIRRTADPQVVLMQAFALYLSLWCAARMAGGAFLLERWGPVRLAVPAAMALLGLMLEDAYATPPRRPWKLVRGPAVGLGLALFSAAVFRAGARDWAVPAGIVVFGCAIGFVLSCAVRVSFPPVTQQLQAARAPALWLKREGGGGGVVEGITRVFKILAIVLVAAGGMWIAEAFALPKSTLFATFVLMLIVLQLWKRA